MSNNPKERDFVTIFAKQGGGKSYLTKKYVIPELAKKRPVFIADPMAEYVEDKDVGYTPDEVFKNAVDLLSYLISNKGAENGIYVFQATTDLDYHAFFKTFGHRDLNITKASLVVEEVDRFCSPHKIEPNLQRLIKYGRHDSIDLVFLSRNAAEVHKDITSQSDVIVSFKQTEHNHINAIKKVWSDAEKLPDLKKHHFLVLGDKQPKKLDKFELGEIKKI